MFASQVTLRSQNPNLIETCRWKESMEERIEKIEEALLSGHSQSSSADLDLLRSPPPKAVTPASAASQPQLTPSQQGPAASPNVTLNLSCSLGAFPASSTTTPMLDEEGVRPGWEKDLISRGLISQDAAERYFAFYQQHLDPYIHHILGDADTLIEVRSRSPLLTAAVCTVASYCIGSKDYQTCFYTFTQEVSGKMFSTSHSFDDVRALCIGALWLYDVSSALTALGESKVSPVLLPANPMSSCSHGCGTRPSPLYYQNAARQA